MFSTPLICCSIGVTTVEATTSELAPGYWPDTLMIGGAISGYCATGRRANDTPPRITNTIETTAAKIGRSIKKCVRRIALAAPSIGLGLGNARLRGRFLILGRHLLSWPHPLQTVDNDAIVGGDTILEHAHVIDDLAGCHEALPRDVVLIDHVD